MKPTPRRLLAFWRRNASARHRWEYIGLDRRDAYRMMDGSRSEGDLRMRGGSMARRLAAALQIGPHHRVLEIGCGVARIGRELAPLCGHYHGVDISRSLLAHARRRTADLDNATFGRIGDAGVFEPAGAHDRVICHKVLLHVDAHGVQERFVDIVGALAPEGLAYVDLWNGNDPSAAGLRAREAANVRLRRQPHRSRFYDRARLHRWLRATGLEPVWMSDRTFLLQAVAMRRDAAAEARRVQEQRLQQDGEGLLPGGCLDFEA